MRIRLLTTAAVSATVYLLLVTNAAAQSSVAPVSATVNGPAVDVVFSAAVLCPIGCSSGLTVRDAGTGSALGNAGSSSPPNGTTTIRLLLTAAVSPTQVLKLE